MNEFNRRYLGRALTGLATIGMCLLVMQAQAQNALVETIAKVRPSVVAVGHYAPLSHPRQRLRGSGFVVANGHYVITCLHVLPQNLNTRQGERLAVFSGRGPGLRYHPAKLLTQDPDRDLALLYIDQRLPALILAANEDPREGQEIAVSGFPLGMMLGLYPVTHRGIISSIAPLAQPQLWAKVITTSMVRAMRESSEVLQLDATAYPGNSGSAVYDQTSGQVVGVINSVFVKQSKETAISDPSGISYAIPVRYVRALIERVP